MNWNIPLFKIYWDEQDVEKTSEVIKSGINWAIGPNIQKFERMLAGYIGAEHAVVFNSGTSALHAALLSSGIGQGDEVIVPSFTFIATVNAPLFVGAKPIFADIEEKTYGLDPEAVEKAITARTRAIVPVHYGGSPCCIEKLAQIAEKHNLLLIEDAAESLGAGVGTFGDAAILSFCANKVITTGEGGAVVTNSEDICEKLKLVRSHGRTETSDYFSTTEYLEYVALGYNFRMSNIAAALGIAQLEKIDEIIQMRREKAGYMTQRLSQIEGITLPSVSDNSFHVYQLYTIRVKGEKEQRDSLMNHLNQDGIMAKVYFHPVHLSQFYRERFGYQGGELPITEKIAGQVLTLPMYPTLTKEEIDYIADEITAFFL